jgi:tetratricopeptide (TPR) repeat protein
MRRRLFNRFVIGLLTVGVYGMVPFAPLAPGAEPGPPDMGITRAVAEKLERWDAEGAWADAQPLLAAHPKDAEVLEIAAQAAFFRGDYPQASRLAKLAAESGGEDKQRMAFAALAESTLTVLKGYKQFETDHFLIKLDEGKDAILAGYLGDALERTYRVVAERFDFRPSEKVRVELFADTRAFYYASTLSARDIEVTGAVGLTQFHKLLFVSPRALVHGYRWLDAISHEYMHYMIMKLTVNKAPVWFHEGLAKHEETRWRGVEPRLSAIHETLLARALADGQFVSFERMDPGLIKLDTPEKVQLAYAEADSAVEFIVAQRGYQGLRALMGGMAQSDEKAAESAVKAVLGWTMAEFEAKWKESLPSQGLKVAEGATVHRYKVKEGLADDDRMEMREIKSMVARNRAHLGDLLQERGRTEAAVLEYRRALQDNEDSVPLLNRLSEALVQLGRDKEALEYLRRANGLAPDHPTTYAGLGQLYVKLNDWVQADGALQSAIQINPFIPTIHRDLATVYEMQGKGEAAAKEKEIFTTLTK